MIDTLCQINVLLGALLESVGLAFPAKESPPKPPWVDRDRLHARPSFSIKTEFVFKRLLLVFTTVLLAPTGVVWVCKGG